MNRLAMTIAAMGIALTAGQAAASNACTTPANVNQMATAIAEGLNANRRANGQSPIRYNPQLSQAAMGHACDMSVNGFFGHNGSNGSNIMHRVKATGYCPRLAAENLAWGYPDPQQIVTGWMNSAGHRSNMLHGRVTEFGIGISNGARGPNWVLVVARSC